MNAASTENVFLSALQPNNSVTTYGLPSDIHIENGSSVSDEVSRAKRVQQQVQMRLAAKSTLPRQNGSTTQYAMSDYGGSSTMKYQTYNPSFSSKSSMMYSAGSRTMGPRVSQRSGFTSQSVGPDLSQVQRMSFGGGVAGGGGCYREEMRMGTMQGNRQRTMDPETASMYSMRMQYNPWTDDIDGASVVSDREGPLSRPYTQSAGNGFSNMRQSTMTFTSPMRRSLSGTLSRSGVGMAGGEAEMTQHQYSFKGPAHRTISRINNRNKMSVSSMSGSMQRPLSAAGSIYSGGDRVDRGSFIASAVSSGSQANLMQRQGTLSRAMSIRSVHSVGRGVDIYNGQMEMGASMGNLSAITSLDMPSAVMNLRDPDPDVQVMGAAYIQHQCYNDTEAKNQVRRCKGIAELVKLFNSESTEVRRYATGATRNLIFENMDNKVALIEEGGIPELVKALPEPDDEIQKNITGIFWNLSSKDTLKEKLAKEILPELTKSILIPLSGSDEATDLHHCPSEADIFYNTTGCLRNLSSVNDKTRQQMRKTSGLVDSLVSYVRASLDERPNEKGVENAMCVLRNLSFQLYNEMSLFDQSHLHEPTRAEDTERPQLIGCFTPRSRKAKNQTKQFNVPTSSDNHWVPKTGDWLWRPEIVSLYNSVLHKCDINSTTREAAAGALQNITAGEKRWAAVLSQVALEQEHMLPLLIDLLKTDNDPELRSITGLLRNLSRHIRDKSGMASNVVGNLVDKLPEDGRQNEPSTDVVINICGILNTFVTYSSVAAREITSAGGLVKLVGIKKNHDKSTAKLRASKAASTVLCNMFQYKKLHKEFKAKNLTKEDFADVSI